MNSISLANCTAIVSSGAELIIKNLLLAIDQKVYASLADIAHSMQSLEMSFDSNEFKELFVRFTTQQIEESFNNFVRNRKINRMKDGTKTKTEEPNGAISDANSSEHKPDDFMVNFRSELAKVPVNKVNEFIGRNPEHNLMQTPTVGVFGVGHRCHICFKPFKSRKHLLLHREESKHHLELAGCMLATPEHRRPLPLFELSPYTDSDSDDEQMKPQRPTFGENRSKALKCPFCPREFTQRTFLMKHEAKHLAQNDTKIDVRAPNKAKGSALKCSICSKQFLNKLMLVKHRQTHAKRT